MKGLERDGRSRKEIGTLDSQIRRGENQYCELNSFSFLYACYRFEVDRSQQNNSIVVK